MTKYYLPLFGADGQPGMLEIELREPPPDTRTSFERARDRALAALRERVRRLRTAVRVLQGERFEDDDD